MAIKLTEATLRRIIREVLDETSGYMSEDMESGGAPAPAKAPAPDSSKGSATNQQLQNLKSSVKMMADAAGRAQQALDNLQSKEALRWVQKTGEFAQRAASVVKKQG